LLWASVYCLLDTSSGASMAVRQMLLQLVQQGYEVHILGATVFDHERGTAGLQGEWPAAQARRGDLLTVRDGPLEHMVYVTASTQRDHMTSREEGVWFLLYQQALEQYRPDVVFYYGGQAVDHLIPVEARLRGIPVAFYLANGNYARSRWCRDVDLILTDSQATADMYASKLRIQPVALGAFIDPARVVAQQHTRERLLFVNPTREKGVALVIRLAMLLERRRPDITFEVVESRGKWTDILRAVSTAMGDPREALSNVVATPNTNDMRPVYGRARLLLAPSLWWESAARVVAEAMLNGIPPIVTDHGGMPEMVGDGGITLRLGAIYHEKPYTRVPPDEALEPLLQRLEELIDDEAQYAELSACAVHVGQTRHSLNASTQRLLTALQPLVARRAGDKDSGAAMRRWHRHGLDDRPVTDNASDSAIDGPLVPPVARWSRRFP
jgi:glycosyltransferase involved in cell wall biosynthesis